MNISLDVSSINQINLKPVLDIIDTGGRWQTGWEDFLNGAGARQGHYKLLAYLSMHFNNKLLLDLGTLTGASSLALAYNRKNRIISFDLPIQAMHNGVPGTDITQVSPELWEEYSVVKHSIPNIEYIKDDYFNHPDLLLESSLIFLDIDHSGIIEQKTVDFLIENNWKGVLIMDDINWSTLQPVWDAISLPKYDITEYGNGQDGTGLVNFGNRYNFILR